MKQFIRVYEELRESEPNDIDDCIDLIVAFEELQGFISELQLITGEETDKSEKGIFKGLSGLLDTEFLTMYDEIELTISDLKSLQRHLEDNYRFNDEYASERLNGRQLGLTRIGGGL